MSASESAARVPCWKCDGEGCEERCGRFRGGCELAHAGPDSHKVCRLCGGSGKATAEEVPMHTYYVTFPVGGVLRDCFTTIEAESEYDARLRIIDVYGRGDPEGHSGFGSVYSSAEAAGVERYGLHRIPFGRTVS